MHFAKPQFLIEMGSLGIECCHGSSGRSRYPLLGDAIDDQLGLGQTLNRHGSVGRPLGDDVTFLERLEHARGRRLRCGRLRGRPLAVK